MIWSGFFGFYLYRLYLIVELPFHFTMASRHQLALDVLDTASTIILKISDASIYSTLLPVDCPRLDIYLPGFLTPSSITADLPGGFIRTLSAHDLGAQPQADEAPRELPDGVYKIAYSVAPNVHTMVEYYHLRTTRTMNAYYRELARVQLATGELSSDQLRRLQDLRVVFSYLQAAKAQTEYCHAPSRGAELLSYAELLLTKFRTGACPTC